MDPRRSLEWLRPFAERAAAGESLLPAGRGRVRDRLQEAHCLSERRAHQLAVMLGAIPARPSTSLSAARLAEVQAAWAEFGGPSQSVNTPAPAASSTSSDASGGSSSQSVPQPVEVADTDPDPGYEAEFRESTREYVFTFPGRTDPLIRSESEVRRMKIDYTSWDGRPHTMDQVARAFGLTRDDFFGIKRALGWTKTSLPLLEHEWDSLTEDEAADELLAIKKRGAEVKARRAGWRETERDAEKWRAFQRGELLPLQDAIERFAESYRPPPFRLAAPPSRSARRYALMVSPTDLHVGKRHDTVNGGRYAGELGTARRRLLGSLRRIMAMLPCPPEVVFATVGGDWFNIDNAAGTTTSGTPQDSAATPPAVLDEGLTLGVDMIELLATVAPVRVVLTSGNHDRMLGQALLRHLGAWFRSDDRVEVGDEISPYVARRYGSNLLAWHHGDGEHRADKLAAIVSTNYPSLWGATRHRYVFLGHWHETLMHEKAGAVTWRMPSLSVDDRWHRREGYTTNQPALLAVALDHEAGWFFCVRDALPIGR